MTPRHRPPLLGPLLLRGYEVWSLESGWFLFYGFFMLAAGMGLLAVPVAGIPLALLAEGPLAGGLVLAVRRVLLQERPGIEDFLGGFRGWERLAGLSLLALALAPLSLAALVLPILPELAAGWRAGAGPAVPALWLGAGCLLLLFAASAFLVMAVPALLLERAGPARALLASWRLARRRPGAVLLLVALLDLVQALLARPALVQQLHQQAPGAAATLPLILGMGLLGPIQGVLATLLYLRLRQEEGRPLGMG